MLKHLQRFPQSPRQGWPSFRDAEVVWENVRCLKNGEAVRCSPPNRSRCRCSALPSRNPRRCEARVSKFCTPARSAQRTLRFSCWAGPGRAGAGHARRVCHMPYQSRPALQVSVDGTHLGHNVPDRRGNRFCINLVSVAGKPAAES